MEKLWKMWENVEILKLTQGKVSVPNRQITKFFTEHLSALEMKKTEILADKPVYLGFSILEIRKILIYQFYCEN